MGGVDQRLLRAAAEAYAAARREYEAANAAAEAAYERLQSSPETIEYKSDWFSARRHEAELAWRLQQAVDAYRLAGGYVTDPDE